MKNQPKWSSVEKTDDIAREERRTDRDRLIDKHTERQRQREEWDGILKTKEILFFETLRIGLGDTLLRDTVQL